MHFPYGPLARRRVMAMAFLIVIASAFVIAITSSGAAMAAEISIGAYRFDPLTGEPSLPRSLQSVPTDGPALYLVQFSGPVEESWKDALKGVGARIFGYIPEDAFIVRMDGSVREAARLLPHVRWVGLFHVAYRISPEIGKMAFRDSARMQDSRRTLVVLTADDLFSTTDGARSLGTVLEMFDDPSQMGFVVNIDPALIPALAALPEVLWVEEKPETFVLNNTTRWVVQSNVLRVLSIWDHGIFGEGQILCEMDSGLDYNSCWFRDTGDAPPGPAHRKVIDYKTWGGGVAYDGCVLGHGTHVAGTAVGDQSYIYPGITDYNGMAYKAKLAMQDVGTDDSNACTQGLLGVPSSLLSAFSDAYALGARVHTNSWGSSSHAYTTMSANVDNFMWSHPDFLICFANGNDGPAGSTVGSPATAKDCVSVGASQQAPDQDLMASYSSRGPAPDGRFKPTVTAPGGPTYIISANNHIGNPPSPTCATQGYPFEGTSMATPAVAGCALLIRDYFAQGFYPLGVAGGNPLLPSAALVKAMLVNTATDMGTGDQPNNAEGWGRILLNDALYFQGDTRELHTEENSPGLATGEQATYEYAIDSSAEPIEVTLVWTDYPASPSANPSLVNDLDLTVVSPAGDTYLGNVYSGGQSVTGGVKDNLNVEECVRRASPEIGVWRITVRGASVPQGVHQPFALVTTGSFANWPETMTVDEGSPLTRIQLEPARPNPTSGSATLAFTLPEPGEARLTVFDASGRRVARLADGRFAAGAHRFEWSGRSDDGRSAANGIYFYRLEAEGTVITRKLTRVR